MPIQIDMTNGWNPVAAWYALALLVEEQEERMRQMRDEMTEAKAEMEAQETR
jgi:hypothetical protein